MTRVWIFLAAILLPASLLPAAACAQGAIIETLEELSNVPSAPAFRGALPPHVDLTANIPPPANQGSSGTCASWATTYAAGSQALRRAGLGATLKLSPSFTYNRLSHDPICKSGTKASATLDMLRDVGGLPFEKYVFDGGWCGRQPTAAELQLAARYRINHWSKLDARRVEDVKSQLARGVPVIFDMRPNDQFQEFKGDSVIDLPGNMNGKDGHSMIAVGYDDARRAFRIQNSWGRKWGDGGYAWVGYDFWARNANVGYVID